MTDSAPKAGPSKPRLGYIGLGNMGAPMATRLLDWPGGLAVCDARAEALEPFTSAGASGASTPADVAAQARIISVTVLDDAQVREVVGGPHGILSTAQPGTVVAIHSTISDTTAVELAGICRQRGVLLVDAPISGGAGGAAQGRLAVMIGGSDEAFEAVREPIDRHIPRRAARRPTCRYASRDNSPVSRVGDRTANFAAARPGSVPRTCVRR